jgi:hypothetical protein
VDLGLNIKARGAFSQFSLPPSVTADFVHSGTTSLGAVDAAGGWSILLPAITGIVALLQGAQTWLAKQVFSMGLASTFVDFTSAGTYELRAGVSGGFFALTLPAASGELAIAPGVWSEITPTVTYLTGETGSTPCILRYSVSGKTCSVIIHISMVAVGTISSVGYLTLPFVSRNPLNSQTNEYARTGSVARAFCNPGSSILSFFFSDITAGDEYTTSFTYEIA